MGASFNKFRPFCNEAPAMGATSTIAAAGSAFAPLDLSVVSNQNLGNLNLSLFCIHMRLNQIMFSLAEVCTGYWASSTGRLKYFDTSEVPIKLTDQGYTSAMNSLRFF